MKNFIAILFGILMAAGTVIAQDRTLATNLDSAARKDSAAVKDAAENQITLPLPVAEPRLNLYGRLQTIGFLQSLNDVVGKNNRLFLFLKQARLGLNGTYEDVKFEMQIAFGGEEVVLAPSPGVTISLLDLSAEIPVSGMFGIKVGQFKVPFSREEMANEGTLQFDDVSLRNLAFRLGRDVGFAAYAKSGDYSGVVGMFTGGGRDVPIRAIPQDLGIPMMVARLGINQGYDNDVFDLKQTDFQATGKGLALFVSGMYTKDSKIGHSTALNVKTADKSLLLNANWNPYIGKKPFSKGEFVQIGTDAAMRMPVGPKALLQGEAELDYGYYSNDFGSVRSTAGRVQVALLNKPFELAMRYSFIQPDANFAATASNGQTTKFLDGSWIQEVAVGVSYFIKSDRIKLTADLPILFGVPVVNDFVSGAYVATEQPDQVSYVTTPTNGKVERQTVVSARLQLQVTF